MPIQAPPVAHDHAALSALRRSDGWLSPARPIGVWLGATPKAAGHSATRSVTHGWRRTICQTGMVECRLSVPMAELARQLVKAGRADVAVLTLTRAGEQTDEGRVPVDRRCGRQALPRRSEAQRRRAARSRNHVPSARGTLDEGKLLLGKLPRKGAKHAAHAALHTAGSPAWTLDEADAFVAVNLGLSEHAGAWCFASGAA